MLPRAPDPDGQTSRHHKAFDLGKQVSGVMHSHRQACGCMQAAALDQWRQKRQMDDSKVVKRQGGLFSIFSCFGV